MKEKFRYELQELINKHSMENGSNTPDFILANYLQNCLNAFDMAVKERETWYSMPERHTEDYKYERG